MGGGEWRDFLRRPKNPTNSIREKVRSGDKRSRKYRGRNRGESSIHEYPSGIPGRIYIISTGPMRDDYLRHRVSAIGFPGRIGFFFFFAKNENVRIPSTRPPTPRKFRTNDANRATRPPDERTDFENRRAPLAPRLSLG